MFCRKIFEIFKRMLCYTNPYYLLKNSINTNIVKNTSTRKQSKPAGVHSVLISNTFAVGLSESVLRRKPGTFLPPQVFHKKHCWNTIGAPSTTQKWPNQIKSIRVIIQNLEGLSYKKIKDNGTWTYVAKKKNRFRYSDRESNCVKEF